MYIDIHLIYIYLLFCLDFLYSDSCNVIKVLLYSKICDNKLEPMSESMYASFETEARE